MIKAQEAYNKSLEKIEEINTLDIMIKAESMIEQSIQQGFFATVIQPIEDIKAAEKVAIELRNEYGYNVSVFPSGQNIMKEDGSFKPAAALRIDWVYLPPNSRDKFSL